MRFLFGTEKKNIVKLLEYYGITEMPFMLIESSKGRLRGYSGSFSNEEITNLNEAVRLEILGLYMFNNFDGDIRLSVDAIHLLKDQITKNILELTDKQADEWMRGQDILLLAEDKVKLKDETPGFKVIRNNGDFLGCGKLLTERIVNYLPKERRARAK